MREKHKFKESMYDRTVQDDDVVSCETLLNTDGNHNKVYFLVLRKEGKQFQAVTYWGRIGGGLQNQVKITGTQSMAERILARMRQKKIMERGYRAYVQVNPNQGFAASLASAQNSTKEFFSRFKLLEV